MAQTVRSVMTTRVRSVRESTPFKDVVRILRDAGVSGVPVVHGDNEVVGVVSEADLLAKQSRWPGVFDRLLHRRWLSRSTGRVAAEVMSSPAITVEADTPLAQAARTLLQHDITRLPVVDRYGALVGIVTRGDMLRVFAREDGELRAEIVATLRENLGEAVCPAAVTVAVTGGVVTLHGEVELRALVPVAVALARGVDGVVDVVDELTYPAHTDDHEPPTDAEREMAFQRWHNR